MEHRQAPLLAGTVRVATSTVVISDAVATPPTATVTIEPAQPDTSGDAIGTTDEDITSS